MTRTTTILLAAAVGAVLPFAAAPASAQGIAAPDVRSVPPVVLLLVDSSGSMERKPDCPCTGACTECLPECNGSAGDERNRWSIVLEALTGRFQDFSCTERRRTTTDFVGQPDHHYFIPHFQPPIGSAQHDDGILDVYVDRVKFGLMSFDGISTFTDMRTDLMSRTEFMARLSDNPQAPGGFSYGEPKPYSFPGCPDPPFMVDSGVRNEDYDAMGRMVSVGGDLETDRESVNHAIQQALLETRPYGPTPIAGMLDDVRHYLDHHPDVAPVRSDGGPGDPYAACRNRFAILLTGGNPNADMRGHPVYCDTDGYDCPYDLPATLAADLCRYGGSNRGCAGKLDGLFVVAFDVNEEAALQELHDLADAGGTGEAIVVADRVMGGATTTQIDALVGALAEALDQAAPSTNTRAVPAFATAAVNQALQSQSQINAGFRIGGPGEPWEGLIERQRFECQSGSLEPELASMSNEDRFHEVLNNRSVGRRLFTVLPTDPGNTTAHLAGVDTGIAPLSTGGGGPGQGGGGGRGVGGSSTTCGETGGGGGHDGTPPGQAHPNDGRPVQSGLQSVPFDTSVGPAYLDVATSAERDEIVRWVHADPGSGREHARLGAIYHSSPAVVGPPQQDIADESFNMFRLQEFVADRPPIMYVGSNDGILHAFAVEDATISSPSGQRSVTTGEEIWGFIPPMLLPKLKSASVSHQWMVDGTPVVKDVFYARSPGENPDPEMYHTILVVGLRGGGNGYIALDVTDPLFPQFLFQFTHPDMGLAYGTPAIGQILVDAGGSLEERAFVFLPGGKGNDLTDDVCRTEGPIGCPARGKGQPPANQGTEGARDKQRCWDRTGRQMFFVDVATGEQVQALDDTVFNAPLSGGASLFQGAVGTIATRAFITDADGVLWRIDISSPNMAEWDADPFYDLFWDAGAVEGQPAYHPPIVTTDPLGRVVVIQGTGDIDRLDGFAHNRVVSVSEDITFEEDGRARDVVAELNWMIRLEPGEQVTGPMDLFFGDVFFATFQSSTSTTDACQFGSSYVYGVHYLDSPEGSEGEPVPRLPTADPDVQELRVGPFENQLINGVAINQQPTCVGLEVSETDPFLGQGAAPLGPVGGGGFQLAALVSGGARSMGGSAFGQLQMDLAPPLSLTQAAAFAGSID
jgi:type IV pilus assembly protein PilY1